MSDALPPQAPQPPHAADEDTPRQDFHERNRHSWNVATAAHNRHKAGQADFLAAGGSTLFAEERQLLGDLKGQRLLHLLCNSGQDTVSLATSGARVTGVDISDEAIATARQLAAAAAPEARFERADVYDFLAQAQRDGENWDLAFFSYGALPWLSDLEAFFAGIAAVLAPGGRLVMVEFHPAVYVLDDDESLRYSYFHRGVQLWQEGVGDYVADSGEGLAPPTLRGSATAPTAASEDFTNPHPSYEFQWSVGEIVSAVLTAGLILQDLQEHPVINGWKAFPNLVPSPEEDSPHGSRVYRWPEDPKLPLMLSLSARKASASAP